MEEQQRRGATYDLHLHTYWSYDASAQVETHFNRARELGMRCLAITEHHVLDSQEEVMKVAEGYPDIHVIPAAELTVNTSIGGVDLLCYGFPGELPPAMMEVLDDYHEWQREFGAVFCRGLQKLGHDFTDEHRLEVLQSYRPALAIDRQGATHIKNQVQRDYFIERGFIQNADEYRELQRRVHGAVSLPRYPPVDKVTAATKEAGALIAIAHPYGYFKHDDRARMDSLREECRLDGVECAHRSVPLEFTSIYREYCEEHGLFSTGGSDCHSDADVQEHLSFHGGEEKWLDEMLERLDGD